MEAGRSLVSSPPHYPLRTYVRNCSSSCSSVLLLHEQATPALTSLSTTSLARHPPTSVLIQDQRNESRPPLCLKDENTFQQTLDRRQVLMEPASSSNEGNDNVDPDQFVNDLQLQLVRRTELWYLFPSLQRKEHPFSMTTESISITSENLTGVEADHVVALARKAFSACIEAASVAKDARLFGAHLDDSSSMSVPVQRIVRSRRLLERQAKRRRVPKPQVEVQETNHRRKAESHRKFNEGFDPNDPLRLFLWGPETTQLLTAKEESDLIVKIQELMKQQAVRSRLQTQFSREPTLVEWAAAVGR